MRSHPLLRAIGTGDPLRPAHPAKDRATRCLEIFRFHGYESALCFFQCEVITAIALVKSATRSPWLRLLVGFDAIFLAVHVDNRRYP